MWALVYMIAVWEADESLFINSIFENAQRFHWSKLFIGRMFHKRRKEGWMDERKEGWSSEENIFKSGERK